MFFFWAINAATIQQAIKWMLEPGHLKPAKILFRRIMAR